MIEFLSRKLTKCERMFLADARKVFLSAIYREQFEWRTTKRWKYFAKTCAKENTALVQYSNCHTVFLYYNIHLIHVLPVAICYWSLSYYYQWLIISQG